MRINSPAQLGVTSISRLRCAVGVLVALTLALFPQPTSGQDFPISVSVNSTHVSTDELVALIVTVVDDSPQRPQPILPPLDGLAVVDIDLVTDVRLVGGHIQTEAVYTYFLQPRRTGSLIIPPVGLEVDGQVYETRAITITVSQGAAPAPSPENAVEPPHISPPIELAGQDFFVQSEVDLARPYVGQQIIYTFRFYQAIYLYHEPQYDGPLFSEFETQGLPVRQYNLDVAGRTYLITEIRMALFPRNPGRVDIPPARLMLPGNIYEAPAEFFSEPVRLEVLALPGNAPPEFKGAVGRFEIQSWLSPRVAVAGQPAKLHIAISGEGNIQLLPEPVWPDLEGWRGYETLTSLSTEMNEDLLTGTQVYERLVVPDRAGEHTIPAIHFAYFDPLAAEYRTISTGPLPVTVLPAPTPDQAALPPLPAVTPLAAVPDAQASPPEEQQAASGRLESLALDQAFSSPMVMVLLLGLCAAVPLGALVGIGGLWMWRSGRKPAEKAVARTAKQQERPQPGQGRHPALTAAIQENGDNYRAVRQALNAHLSHILQTPVNGLTRTALAAHLRRRGLDEALIERLGACLAECDLGRYSPLPPGAGWSLMATAEALLFELDRAFGR
ncbi:MAG: BatD family protein [Anaerolineae bacterium]